MALWCKSPCLQDQASLHTKKEAKRVYGIIASGAQIGQLVASVTAATLFGIFGNAIVLVRPR